jgi:hypothetical protein
MKPRHKGHAWYTNLLRRWPAVFWLWMIGVSIWIDNAPINNPEERVSPDQFSNFAFAGMRFEQRYEAGTVIQVTSEQAIFDAGKRMLTLDQPFFNYTDRKTPPQTIQANGNEGLIEITDTGAETGLPTEFSELTLTGDAFAQGEKWSVASSKLIFNNKESRIYFPEKSVIRQQGSRSTLTGFMYDIESQTMKPISK